MSAQSMNPFERYPSLRPEQQQQQFVYVAPVFAPPAQQQGQQQAATFAEDDNGNSAIHMYTQEQQEGFLEAAPGGGASSAATTARGDAQKAARVLRSLLIAGSVLCVVGLVALVAGNPWPWLIVALWSVVPVDIAKFASPALSLFGFVAAVVACALLLGTMAQSLRSLVPAKEWLTLRTMILVLYIIFSVLTALTIAVSAVSFGAIYILSTIHFH